tara:strand:+ start:18758 stop:19285 length:528 start_codon:yes stop_codon:yes gene_type:complete
MIAFVATLLFAVTGLTLNHAAWFEGGEPSIREVAGEIDAIKLAGDVDKLAIAEELRAKHHLQGMVKEFSVDERECFVLWKGPGYSADVIIDRETHAYTGEVQSRSWMAVLDDLHKGRDCGPVWSWVIDVSAVLLTVLSLTGIWLLLYLKKRRRSGLIVGLVGCVLVVVSYAVGVH